ncbi:hypothetical protein [Psychrobacter proteolyticus]|uniref:DUF1189 domain-containing protein n=1 Tax=Psychrobacter proteolyticus TaxID=147825 RepID=A0ABV0D3P1_9GAMM
MDQEADKVEHMIAKNLRSNEVKENRSVTYYIGGGLRFIGDNTKILLTVTYGLGATAQVLKLSAIDPTYIKFFSVTQLIADGAFFISLIFLGYISFLAFSLFFKLIGINDVLVSDLKNNHKSESLLLTIKGISILLLPFSIFVFYHITMAGYFNNKIISMIITYSFIYSLLSEILKYSYEYDNHIEKITGDDKIGNGAVYRFLVGMGIIFSIITIPKFIYDTYNLPPNLDNYDKAKQVVMTDYKDQGITKQDVDILYFNDKFMFIEIIRPNNERSIAVYQTNSMLFDTRVITLSEE